MFCPECFVPAPSCSDPLVAQRVTDNGGSKYNSSGRTSLLPDAPDDRFRVAWPASYEASRELGATPATAAWRHRAHGEASPPAVASLNRTPTEEFWEGFDVDEYSPSAIKMKPAASSKPQPKPVTVPQPFRFAERPSSKSGQTRSSALLEVCELFMARSDRRLPPSEDLLRLF